MRTWLWYRLHYRETCTRICAECNFWAIRDSQLVQVDQLDSYPLVFIHLRYNTTVHYSCMTLSLEFDPGIGTHHGSVSHSRSRSSGLSARGRWVRDSCCRPDWPVASPCCWARPCPSSSSASAGSNSAAPAQGRPSSTYLQHKQISYKYFLH